jgi:hypothetical protein
MPFKCSFTVGDCNLEKIGDKRLSQPQRLVLETALDLGPAILGLVEKEF